MSEMTIKVIGMNCHGCERSVENQLSRLDGVKRVKADHMSGSVLIEYAGAEPQAAVLKATVDRAGYKFIE